MDAQVRSEQQQLQLQNYEKYTLDAAGLKALLAEIICLKTDLRPLLIKLHGACMHGQIDLPDSLKYCISHLEQDLLDLDDQIRKVMGKTKADQITT